MAVLSPTAAAVILSGAAIQSEICKFCLKSGSEFRKWRSPTQVPVTAVQCPSHCWPPLRSLHVTASKGFPNRRRCNCSICKMKGNVHFMVPKPKLTLVKGSDCLSEYTFGTHTAKHLFCRVCGVTPYYSPRSNPDAWAVTVACVKPSTLACVTVIDYDGVNWESAFEKTGIAAYSKPSTE